MVKTKEMKLECIFCGSSNFQIPHKDYVPKENENIKCGNCGKLNIYGSFCILFAISLNGDINLSLKLHLDMTSNVYSIKNLLLYFIRSLFSPMRLENPEAIIIAEIKLIILLYIHL